MNGKVHVMFPKAGRHRRLSFGGCQYRGIKLWQPHSLLVTRRDALAATCMTAYACTQAHCRRHHSRSLWGAWMVKLSEVQRTSNVESLVQSCASHMLGPCAPSDAREDGSGWVIEHCS
ncbi:hypothetical protein LIA77_01565 [Sarocladium implicatum]|nr:hypothetical protein LIA77_01565 [Sarocladium implicatum]